ncbi:MAG: PKD domain-containing protein [Actinobacteria bacterium]|nr:PKD domain-containing protein [Actinomycetota bacterium]
MTFTFAETTGDCATFTSPEPVEQRPGRPGRPPRPSPEEIARTLADRAVSLAPEPDLRVTPSGIGLTGLESYFWLETSPSPIEATAQAGPVLVTAQARAVQYVWNFGDGSDMVTNGSGRRWSASRGGNIGHVYETRGRYELAVDVVWEARWRIGAGPWQSLGYFSNSDSRPYRVRQVIAVLTEPE